MKSLFYDYEIKLDLYDLSLAAIYFALIYIFAFFYKREKIKTHPEYKYFILALTLKVFGGMMFALLTVFYYKGGDTMGFFHGAVNLSNVILERPLEGLEILFSRFYNDMTIKDNSVVESFYFMDINATDVLTIVKITTIINLIGLYSYGATTVIFASISFVGVWAGYSNFCKIYPQYKKSLLIGFFMVPTIIFWGSGILKDSVTISCIGWMIYGISNIFILRKRVSLSVLIIFIAAIFIFLLKSYLLYLLIPSFLIWAQSNIKNLIKGSFIRIILIPIIMALFGISTFVILSDVSANAGKYDVNQLEKTLAGFQQWHGHLNETLEQSGYSLGEMEFTPIGILKSSPAALNVTFFRPYLWEVRNIPTLIGAVESFILFIFFMYLLLKLRGRFFRIIMTNKEVMFLLLFAITFGVIVGISSYNFGALSRYKMPAQMFFVVALTIIYQTSKNDKRVN